MDGTGYHAGRAHPALAGLVLGYGGYREYSAGPLRRRQAPTGSCTVILSFEPALRLHGPAGPVVTTSFLSGMHDAAVVTEFTGVQHGMQVDLSPLGAYTLLGRPLSELTNRTPRVDELGVPALAALPSRLAHDPGWPERFARVDATLLGLLDASRTRPDPEVEWAWSRLAASGGRVGVAELAAGSGSPTSKRRARCRSYGRDMSIHPTLRYSDARTAIAFLTSALGMREGEVSTDGAGTIVHAQLSVGGDVLMLGTRADPPGPFDPAAQARPGRASTYLAVDDPDAAHDRAVAAGAEVVMGLTDQPYGSREFAVVDREGNVWSVGTYRPVVAP